MRARGSRRLSIKERPERFLVIDQLHTELGLRVDGGEDGAGGRVMLRTDVQRPAAGPSPTIVSSCATPISRSASDIAITASMRFSSCANRPV